MSDLAAHKEFIENWKEHGWRNERGTLERHDKKYYKQGMSPYDYHCKREVDMKEHYIAIAHQQLLRERLAVCVRSEGVNQFVNCKELREKYAEVCRDRYHGQLFAEGDEPAHRQTPGLIVKAPEVDFRIKK